MYRRKKINPFQYFVGAFCHIVFLHRSKLTVEGLEVKEKHVLYGAAIGMT
jgi:hypothetical protein